MVFTSKCITVGKGRVSSARTDSLGNVGIVMAEGAGLVLKTIPAGKNQPLYGSAKLVSYADECCMLDGGKLEKRGGLRYEAS